MIRPEALSRDEPLLWSTGRGADVWEMLTAAAAGDTAGIERLLSRDPSLVRCSHAYRTPLSFAVREDRVAAAALLLERGASPFAGWTHGSLLDIARDRGYAEMQALLETRLASAYGISAAGDALAEAIRAGDLARVRAMLDVSPEHVEAGDQRSNRPLHWAVMTRRLDFVDELLARGADIEAQRADGARAMQLTNGDYHYRGWRDVPDDGRASPGAVLAHLVARGAYVDICTAADMGEMERVAALLEEDPSLANRVSPYVTYYPRSGAPLRSAAGKGHLEIVKLLLARGADPNLPEEGIAPRGHALYAAVSGGHLDVARLLLQHGAEPSAPVESSADCLSIALSRGDAAMIELLASHGASRSVEILAYYGDVVTAAAVFAADPALADDPVALAAAAEEGQEAFVRLMLRHAPGLARRVGVGAKSPGLTELLFAHGMDPGHRDWLLATPLHRLAMKGDLENAAIFIDHGADLHARDEELRSTPLACAAMGGQLRMAELLLERGAQPRLADDPPWATPLAWATRRGHRDVAALLERHGA